MIGFDKGTKCVGMFLFSKGSKLSLGARTMDDENVLGPFTLVMTKSGMCAIISEDNSPLPRCYSLLIPSK